VLAAGRSTRMGGFTPDWGPLAWVALIPFYLSLSEIFSGKQAFRLGLILGMLLYGISLYWIFIALHVYGEISVVVSLVAMAILVLILAAYLGGAVFISYHLRQRGLPLAVGFPLAWVLQDWVRNFFPLGGFSWSSLVYSQGDFLSLLQIADLTGPYGVTFLILMVNALLGEVAIFLQRRRPFPKALLLTVLALVGGGLFYGILRTRTVERVFERLPEKKLVLIQGNIPQEEKWMEENVEAVIRRHAALTEEAEARHQPQLILWPEAAYPALLPPGLTDVGIVDTLKTPLLLGAVTYEGVLPEEWPPPRGSDFRLYNSAVVIDPGGVIRGRYHKNHLVPIGEYVPMERILFFIEKIVPGIASFTPGGNLNLLEAADLKLGITICFEDLFPEISRAFVRQGADLLVNLTNDAWYERSSAVLQHLEFSRLRAIENRRYLVRATNTGMTAVFDPIGRIIAEAPLFEEAILPATVRIGGPETFYSRFEDIAVLIALLFLVAAWFVLGRWHR